MSDLTDRELQSLRNMGNEAERAADELTRLRSEVERLRVERDAFKQTMHDEMDENLRLRELGGARPDEGMTAFLERVFAERRLFVEAPKLKHSGGWWSVTGARIIVESNHPAGGSTHRELSDAERKEWAYWFAALHSVRYSVRKEDA